MTELGPDMKRPFDWGRGYLVNITAAVLVLLLLSTCVLGLGLSILPVMVSAGRTYDATTSGEVLLPFYPGPETGCFLEAPPSVDEGVPFNVTLTFKSGERPFPVQFIVIGSELGEVTYRLWDSWDEQGAWKGWTRVPGLEGGVNWTIAVWSGWKMEDPVKIGSMRMIEVRKGSISFLIPSTDDRLSFENRLFREVRRKDWGMYHPTYILVMHVKDRAEYQLDPFNHTFYGLPGNRTMNHHWSEFDIICQIGPLPSFPFLHITKYQNGFLLRTGSSAASWDKDISLTFETVMHHMDSLYDLEARTSAEGRSGNITLMADTYYDVRMSCDLPGSIYDWHPLPDITIRIGGKAYPMSPIEQGIDWTCRFRSPGGYGSDGRSDLVVEWTDNGSYGNVLLSYGTYLSTNPAPDLIFSPDPYCLPCCNDPGPLRIVLRGEWELVNWREFRESPTLWLNGSNTPMVEVVEGHEYNATLIVGWEGTTGERTLKIDGTTYFEPAETILLFLKLKGPVLLIWFVLVTVVIIASCALLIGRGLRPFLKGGAGRRGHNIGRFLQDKGNDVIETSRVYIGALFFSITIVILFEAMEQPTPVPDILKEDVPVWIRMVLLANASVWEEVVARVGLIGVPLALLQKARGSKGKALRSLFGGMRDITPFSAGLILFSAGLFGLAHIGWGPWKVVPTLVTGVLFGYLYVRVGLHASIVMHFLFDYRGFFPELTSSEGAIYLFLLLIYFMLFFGGPILGCLLKDALDWLRGDGHVLNLRPWIPSWTLLLAHSITCTLLGCLLFLNGGDRTVGVLLFSAPLLDGAALLLTRFKKGKVACWIVYLSSLASLPAAPLGMAWVADITEETVSNRR